MTLENMREDLLEDLTDLLGESVLVVRSGTDVNVDFPMVVVDFLGTTKPWLRTLSLTFDGSRPNWIMDEPVHVKIYTQEPFEGEDTSRADLQELVDIVEFHAEKNWPSILSKHKCALNRKTSFMTSNSTVFYNDTRVNEAVIRIHLEEPRYPTEADTLGNLADKVNIHLENVDADDEGEWIIEVEN